jgi:hypothetical protein
VFVHGLIRSVGRKLRSIVYLAAGRSSYQLVGQNDDRASVAGGPDHYYIDTGMTLTGSAAGNYRAVAPFNNFANGALFMGFRV